MEVVSVNIRVVLNQLKFLKRGKFLREKQKLLKIERYIKQLSRVEKEIIIAEPLSLQSIFNL